MIVHQPRKSTVVGSHQLGKLPSADSFKAGISWGGGGDDTIFVSAQFR